MEASAILQPVIALGSVDRRDDDLDVCHAYSGHRQGDVYRTETWGILRV